ncbi:MAG: NAD(P)H-dependent flavin oxidoreductase, partial [Solimonas sp.]
YGMHEGIGMVRSTERIRTMGSASSLRTPVCDLLDCDVPVVQAGMGGVARSELVAAVANAGGYGILGMVRESPELILQEIATVREHTERPFGVNLIPFGTDPTLLDEELAACFEARIHSLCFFWTVRPELVRRAKTAGCRVLYQVGTLADARAAEQAGADIVICQGVEAGGHVHGTVSSLVLLPQVASVLSIPVLGSGGFATGGGLVAALALGAQGIHCGTAFLATRESYAHDFHKRRVVEASSGDTVHSDVFAINWPAGSPVRTLVNSVTMAYRDNLWGHGPNDFPREVIGHEGQRLIYRFSTDSPLRNMTGDFEAMAPFAGQACGLIDDICSAGERLRRIVGEAETIMVQRCGTLPPAA